MCKGLIRCNIKRRTLRRPLVLGPSAVTHTHKAALGTQAVRHIVFEMGPICILQREEGLGPAQCSASLLAMLLTASACSPLP